MAVIGGSRRAGSVGRVILRNIISAGFGPVYPVHPYASELDGLVCVPSVAALPDQVDLAVIAVPAGAVLGIADDCGRRGVKALVVIAAGLSGPARAELLAICRRHGMRMVGPASFGVANPGIGLDATFAARHAKAGIVGLALQSTGGTGFTLLEHLSRLGVGISSLVSFGDKDDVSGTDMLQWWESDKETKLALLYLESIGNPPKFARTARHVGRTTPILTVAVGRSATGRRLAGARAATTATPLITRQALFQQAGIIAAANLGELLDTAALLVSQPVPAGNRVGVVSNTRGAAVLAADACADAGLQIASLAGNTQQALREILGPDSLVAGPVDTTSSAGLTRQLPPLPGSCRRRPGRGRGAGADHHNRGRRPGPRSERAARLTVPIAAAILDQMEVVRLLPSRRADRGGGFRAVPAYAYAESAARALGHAARYGIWRATPPGHIPDLDGLRPDRARELVTGFLAAPSGAAGCRWTPLWSCSAATASRWPTASGSSAKKRQPLRRSGSAASSHSGRTYPLLRTSDAGDVLTDLHGPDEVRRGFRLLRETFGSRLTGVIVQPVVTGGIEVVISVLRERVAGPLVLLKIGGPADNVQLDRAARLAPLTESDADDLIRSVHAAPRLLRRRGEQAADLAALRDTLLRVSRMVDDLHQIAELELSPVIARPDGVQAVDGRIRIQAAEPIDAHLRRLP